MEVLLAPGIFPPDSGGPATFAPDIARGLVERGHSVRTVTNGTSPEGFDDDYPFDVVRIPRGKNALWRYARQIRTLVAETRAFSPNVIFTNAFDFQTAVAGRITGTPVLTKVVGDSAWERARQAGVDDDIETFQRERYDVKTEFLRGLRTVQTRSAQQVVVPSEYLKSVVESWGVPARDVSVIYNSIGVEPRSVPESDRENRIVTVGRLVPWKGIDGVIDAFAKLETETELHVIGDGPERERLERRATEYDCRDAIVFHGRIPHERVLDVVAHSRVFVLNSTYEGLPHTVLEAMACGTPVVATAAGGTPETIDDGESGYLVEPGDTDSLADRFARLLEDTSLRQRFRERAFERLDTRFDHSEMLTEYERLLARVSDES